MTAVATTPTPTATIRFRSGSGEQTGELLSCTKETPASPILRPWVTFEVRQPEWRWVPDIEIWHDEYGRPCWRKTMAWVQFYREFTVYPHEVIEISDGEQVIQFTE
jgi:hypothetical protein